MIAISATGKKTRDLMEIRFARSHYFVFIDTTGTVTLENPFLESTEDAAPQVIEWLEKLGVTKVVTGELGPNALNILQEKRIQAILFDAEKISIQNIRKKMNI